MFTGFITPDSGVMFRGFIFARLWRRRVFSQQTRDLVSAAATRSVFRLRLKRVCTLLLSRSASLSFSIYIYIYIYVHRRVWCVFRLHLKEYKCTLYYL